jgi:hypothetical protein
MDAIFALIFIVYILSAVFQAVLGKGARKRQRGAGAPWPRTRIPGKRPDEGTHVPDGFPFPFPFEEIFGDAREEEPAQVELESEDVTDEPMAYEEKEILGPWEDKSWGSLGPSLEGQSLEEIESNDFYGLRTDDDFADDFDNMALVDDDIAEFMALSEPFASERWKLASKSAVIQGIIMSEVLKRPKAFSRYPVTRK